MPFGNQAKSIRAYRYEMPALARKHAINIDLAVEQHRLRVAYWNALVELDNERRDRTEQLIAEHIGEPPATEDEQRAARKAAFANAEIKLALKALDGETYERQKQICNEQFKQTAERPRGLWHGNYMDVVANWRTACRDKRNRMRFHRFNPREGKISVLHTNGLAVEQLMAGEDTYLQVAAFEPNDGQPMTKARRKLRLLRARIGSDPPGSRNAVWFEIPFALDRPLPPGGLVRQTHITWRRRAGQTVWAVSFTVELPATEQLVPSDGPEVAVDLGWRRVYGDGYFPLRAGYWMGTDGERGEVLLDERWQSGIEKVSDLQSIRDQHRDSIRDRLTAWLDQVGGVPEWLAEERKTMRQWRSPGRFAALALRWRQERFPGDAPGYDMLERWRAHDRHLWEWQEHQRARLLRQRRELYRVTAKRLSERYTRVVIEDFDLRRVSERNGDNDLPPAARKQRVQVAPGEFRSALVNAFRRDHGAESVIVVDAAYTTLACPSCGAIDPAWEPATELAHTCPSCGAHHDQDHAACLNLLARADYALT